MLDIGKVNPRACAVGKPTVGMIYMYALQHKITMTEAAEIIEAKIEEQRKALRKEDGLLNE